MSTPRPSSPLQTALSGVPQPFRGKLTQAYEKLKHDHREGRYDSAGLSAGKFSEVALRLLQQQITGSFVPFGTKIANFADECRKLESTPASSAVESLRLVLPRALLFMYTVRNKRGIGHVGGDVEANRIDSATLARLADWIVCELIRIYHGLSLEEAQDLVDTLSQKELPDVWEVGGKKRVLRKDLPASQQALLLLYSEPSQFVLAEDLCSWVEYSQPSMFKRNVLTPLHRRRLIEHDAESDLVYLSPLGISEVETHVLPKVAT